MLSGSQRGNTKLALKELFSLWDERLSLYGNVFFGSAVSQGEDKKWRNVTTFLLPMHKTEFRAVGSVAHIVLRLYI